MNPFWRVFDRVCAVMTGLAGVILVFICDIWNAVTPSVIIDLLCIAIVLGFPVVATVIPSFMGIVK